MSRSGALRSCEATYAKSSSSLLERSSSRARCASASAVRRRSVTSSKSTPHGARAHGEALAVEDQLAALGRAMRGPPLRLPVRQRARQAGRQVGRHHVRRPIPEGAPDTVLQASAAERHGPLVRGDQPERGEIGRRLPLVDHLPDGRLVKQLRVEAELRLGCDDELLLGLDVCVRQRHHHLHRRAAVHPGGVCLHRPLRPGRDVAVVGRHPVHEAQHRVAAQPARGTPGRTRRRGDR